MRLKRLIQSAKSSMRHPVLYSKHVLKNIRRKKTDIERWANDQNLDPDWGERTQIIASKIAAGSSVIEFGAGGLALQAMLPESCSYQPSDVVSRSAETIVLDLNHEFPRLPQRYDYAVFSGVIEYVNDVSRVLVWLHSVASKLVMSYAITDNLHDPITRMQSGWLNHLSDAELKRAFAEAGWRVERVTNWRAQVIYELTAVRPRIG